MLWSRQGPRDIAVGRRGKPDVSSGGCGHRKRPSSLSCRLTEFADGDAGRTQDPGGQHANSAIRERTRSIPVTKFRRGRRHRRFRKPRPSFSVYARSFGNRCKYAAGAKRRRHRDTIRSVRVFRS